MPGSRESEVPQQEASDPLSDEGPSKRRQAQSLIYMLRSSQLPSNFFDGVRPPVDPPWYRSFLFLCPRPPLLLLVLVPLLVPLELMPLAFPPVLALLPLLELIFYGAGGSSAGGSSARSCSPTAT